MLAKGVIKGHRCNPVDPNSRWRILRSDLLEFMKSGGMESIIPESWLVETPESILERLVAWSESNTAHPTDVYAIVDDAKAWLNGMGGA